MAAQKQEPARNQASLQARRSFESCLLVGHRRRLAGLGARQRAPDPGTFAGGPIKFPQPVSEGCRNGVFSDAYPEAGERPLALIGWLGLLAGTGLTANLAHAAVPPERILPDSTVFLLKLNDTKSFREAFLSSQYGQLWNDPALKDFRVELAEKLDDATKGLKERIGITFKELLEIPKDR